MARGRPHGRSKSDHRVCQAARHARAAEYKERIAISAEQQEARIAAVNAECNEEDAPRRRRGQKPEDPKTKASAARVSAQGHSCKATGSGKKKANKRLEHAHGKAAQRDPHNLDCHACGATAEFGLRGSKEGGNVKYSCRVHATYNGCFRVDRDRAAWVEDRELRHLRAEERRLEEELRNLGGTSPDAKQGSAPNDDPKSEGDWTSVAMSKPLITTLLMIGGIEQNPGPTPDEIAQLEKGWREECPNIRTALLAHLTQKDLDVDTWKRASVEQRMEYLTEWRATYSGQWADGWDLLLKTVPTAARGRGTEGAGASRDVEMPDVDYGRAAGTRQTGAVAGPSQDTVMQDASRGDYRRRSNDDNWDDSVDEEVRKVLERAFVSPEKNGQPKLDLRPPPSSNPCARSDVSVVYYGNTPGLLLTSLPGRNERGLTNAQTLLAQNKQLHASKGGQDQVQTRATALIAPSGGGKSRTALEASCHEYSFYLSFSTEKEPGTNILREAIDRLRERHRDEFARVRGDASGLQDFRENMLHDMKKFISRILLAFALGLLEYLRQHGDHASPRGFLLFQLIGISTQEDWLLKTWGCLLSLSREAVELKLQATMEELRRRTRQDFFNTFLDESQAGMRILDGYFPSRDGTEGRPLLNGLVRSLHHNIFTHFHFNLTGTGLSLRLSQQLDTAVSEEGAAQLASFTDFPPFTMDGALQYTQEFLQSPPEGARVHILVGRPRFAAQLVQKVLLGKSWEEALQALVELHSGQNSPTSLLRGLHEMQTKLSGDLFDQLVAELRCLVLGYYVVGKGVSTGKTNVDMIEVGVCHLAHLGGVGEYSMMTLVEPLAALAVTSFLRSATHWRLEDQGLALLRTSPSDAAMGALFERIIPQAQLRLVTSNTCLADHPLFEGFVGLPNCFYGPARVVSLLGQGEKSYELKIDDIPRVETWRKGRGLIEFLREPGDVSFFFPEEGAGPDHASYLSIADELWLGILQAKCRKKVPNKAHALGTLNIRTMYKGEKNPGEKRSQLTTLLKQRGVKGILRILLAYPAQVNAASYAQSTLRRSERLQALEGNEFEVVQLCISRSNAEHYLTDDERHHLDCLKDIS